MRSWLAPLIAMLVFGAIGVLLIHILTILLEKL